MNSTHKVEIVRVQNVEPHPNADKMEIVKVFGYTCCVGKGQFKPGDLAAYICPESVIPESLAFEFLGTKRVIAVKRLRGVYSQGLLIAAPEGSKEGDNVAEILGVTHYEPPIPMSTGGEAEKPPPGFYPYYDVDSWYRYNTLFKDGEGVVASEKIHGSSSRYHWADDRMYCGSRGEWKKQDDKNLWWRALRNCPEVEAFCKEHPDMTVYGEVYGNVKNYSYGCKKGEVRIAVFDILQGNNWLSYGDAKEVGRGLPWVPEVYLGKYDKDIIFKYVDGKTLMPDTHIREGIVIKPLKERTDYNVGRVQLKLVSNLYLEGR